MNNNMVQTRNVAKRQKVEECTSCMESVLFSSDSLFKISSYLPADGLLNLALTCRRFGIAPTCGGGDDNLSLVDETSRRIVQDIATDEEMATLPGYDDNWLSKYNHLHLLRAPLTFDQLVGQQIKYMDGNKSRVVHRGDILETAFSNNIMMAGKHYVSFEVCNGVAGAMLGVMRPGEAMQSAQGYPLEQVFFNNFTQDERSLQYNNTVNCCMYCAFDGYCWSSDWEANQYRSERWMGWRISLVQHVKLECYLIWMRGHYHSTKMEGSWV